MSALVLTVMLAVVWVLFVALGFWHGGWREVVALAGILLSYAVLSEWAGPNGRDLSGAFGWSLARTVTGVALAYLIGGAAILGYLSSMLFPRPYPIAMRERLLGALVGVLNGGLMLALTLRVLRAYLFAPGEGQALHDSLLARFLIEQIGYVLIVAFVAGIVAIVVGFILTLRRTAIEESPMEEGYTAPLTATAPPQLVPLSNTPATETAWRPASRTEPVSASPMHADAYTAVPVIDWPATPPPGLPVAAPPATVSTERAPAAQTVPARPASPPLAPPTELRVPARVPPPMWYPVESLPTGVAKEIAVATEAPQPAQSNEAPPPIIVTTAAAPPPAPARPVMPPPGVPAPQPPSSPVAEATSASPESPIIVRELDLTTRDSVPVPSPPVAASEDETLDSTPTTRSTVGAREPEPVPETETRPAAISAQPSPADTQPSREENSVAATAALPTVTPSRLPPVTPPVVGEPDTARPRGSFARVAQTRQAAGQPPLPAPQPPRQPDGEQPLRPPVPTGPDIRPCPACGYPVRPHARYCPNCGQRLAR